MTYKWLIRWLWVAVVLGAAAVAAVGWLYAKYFAFIVDSQVWGTFGDYFGGTLNPIFSFAAFLILLATLALQFSERETRAKEHKETVERQDKETLERSIHESRTYDDHRFFNLTPLLHEVAKSVSIEAAHPAILNGHRAISQSWLLFESSLPRGNLPPNEIYENLRISYLSWRDKYWSDVGSYFELALHILNEFIINYSRNNNSTPSSDAQAEHYYQIFRSQLTIYERNILFYEMINSEVWHKHAEKLALKGFWRGGKDRLNSRRADLISASRKQFRKKR